MNQGSDAQQLAVREATAIVREGFDDRTRELIRTAVSDRRSPLTTDEFELFLAVCRHTGLNPLLKEIYCARIDGRFTILTGIDGHRKIAQASRRFRGMAGPLWCGPDGRWTDVWLSTEAPAACKVGVYLPGVAEPTWGVAYFKNYRAKTSPTWTAMPEHMLAVRAEAFALRKCFSRELGGVALPEDDDAVEGGSVDAPAPPAGRSPRMRRLIAEMDAAVADDATTDVVDPEQVPEWADGDEQEQPPPDADRKRLEATALYEECRAAGMRVAEPHPRATEAALDEYIGRHRRALNARAAR